MTLRRVGVMEGAREGGTGRERFSEEGGLGREQGGPRTLILNSQNGV